MIRKQTLINAIAAAINRIEAMMPTNRHDFEPELTIVHELEIYKRTLEQLKDNIMFSRQAIIDELETLQGEHRDKIQTDLELDDKLAKKKIKDVNVEIDKIQQYWHVVNGVLKKRIT